MIGSIVIRPLALAEVQQLLCWAKHEGWNPGLDDAAAFYAADPEGFLGCFVDDKLAAGISAVRYGSNFGFTGLYITRPGSRGKGYGRRVWDAGMALLDGRTIGLDGVPEQQANYRRMGFAAVSETFRWSGVHAGTATSDTDVIDVMPSLLPAIAAFDRNFFAEARDAFLNAWLAPPRVARAIVRNGEIQGYAVARACHDGVKIGPLFAQTPADAKLLLDTLAATSDGQTLHIDVPAGQTAFSDDLQALGFVRGFATARMYKGPPPALNQAGIFGITSLELG
ncbi:GNAT family N-acetyltransferase [Rhizobium sp. CG5]|uniref:GNAT family N-acetyltransferase n=1 Tax=Rhizobium sp. CG5 TaxID=2726076 RepID=UPI00203345C9|nr:GNAT family N-acetyltransferase [Rhizobium sp. CG5]MCM2474109.1 GNAT family N-acetyltransferase [Rhizobium sp. CG5]